MENGYYWAYGYDGDYDYGRWFRTYEKAFECAKKSHKEEIAYQKELGYSPKYDDIQTDYVILYREGYEPVILAEISGWRNKTRQWELVEEAN